MNAVLNSGGAKYTQLDLGEVKYPLLESAEARYPQPKHP